MWSRTGPGFHNAMEARGPVQSDSPLQGGSSHAHSFIRSFIAGPLRKESFRTVTTCPFGEASGTSLTRVTTVPQFI